MTTITRKYYAMIPSMFSFDGEPYWLELLQVKTLTSAQQYVDHSLGGCNDAEIGVSINGGDKAVVSKRNSEGKWEIVRKDTLDHSNPYANDQVQYSRNGPCSKEQFFNGFQKEK